MGFMNWIMRGVDEEEKGVQSTKEFDESTIQNLKSMSNNEKQEKTTLSEMTAKNTQNVTFQGQNMQTQSNPAYNPYGFPNGINSGINNQYSQNMQSNPAFNAGPMTTMQNVYMQSNPNQPFAQTTITIFQVSNQDDIKLALTHLGKRSPCAISFCKMNKRKKDELYQFLSGGVFALGAKIVKWNENYLLTPRGMEVSKQDTSKK